MAVSGIIGIFLALIGLLGFALAFIVPILVVLNARGVRSALFSKAAKVPGFRSGTTWKAGLAAAGYLLIASIILVSVGVSLVPPDEIEIRDTSLSPTELPIGGGSAEVSGIIVNNGNESKALRVDLVVDGTAVDSKEVNLASGEEQEIRFTREFTEGGEHDISLAPEGWDSERVGTLRVNSPTPTATRTPTPTASPTPTATPTPIATPTATPNPTDDEHYTNLIQGILEDQGIDVRSIEVADGRENDGDKAVIIQYQTSNLEYDEVTGSQMGAFTGSFIVAVESGWDIDGMIVVIGDEEGSAVGTYIIDEEWIQQYLNDEISDEELYTRIVSTLVLY